ncbi:N-alpha-acetyltransferase 30 [Elysia marginata]|uniref:N-terminal methionine N(alpha)-acetyltransferase NatC n=1 Tax=Elysia marginata TaxID=1093978 RepID=A0AAV4IFY0_9GAST|nr:N-alpha-acetyltransferase 30 [Elysia marginata]
MAEQSSTTPVCPLALREPENNSKNVSSCCFLSNNDDGSSGKEQNSATSKDYPGFKRTETLENGDGPCNGRLHLQKSNYQSLSQTDTQEEVLFDSTAQGKKLNGLNYSEYNLNDNGISKNVSSTVNEGTGDCEDGTLQTGKTKPMQKLCQNHDGRVVNDKSYCISEQHTSLDKQVDGLVKNLEDVSVSPSATCVSSDCERPSTSYLKENSDGHGIEYVVYESEKQMPDIMRLITKDLSEPYSIYTYRYFIHNWPRLCFLAKADNQCVGAIVCKLDLHKKMARRGYIAMLAVDSEYRRRQIGSTLVTKAIEAMIKDDCDEVVLETEITNQGALHLYENLGFVRDKRLFRYYLNGVDALRLKLWLR